MTRRYSKTRKPTQGTSRARPTATLAQTKGLEDLSGVKVVGQREPRGAIPPVSPADLASARAKAAEHGLEIIERRSYGGARLGLARSPAATMRADAVPLTAPGRKPDNAPSKDYRYSFQVKREKGKGHWVLLDWFPSTARAYRGGMTGGRAAAMTVEDIDKALDKALDIAMQAAAIEPAKPVQRLVKKRDYLESASDAEASDSGWSSSTPRPIAERAHGSIALRAIASTASHFGGASAKTGSLIGSTAPAGLRRPKPPPALRSQNSA